MDSEQPSTSKAAMEVNKEHTAKEKNQKRFTVVKWEAKALWAWDVNVDNCAICRNALMEPCIDCQANPDTNTECSIAWGLCTHAFHSHCIGRWIKTRNVCPLDNKEWVYDRFGK